MVFRRMVAQNHLFLEKKMVSNQKTIFFSRKPKKTKKKKNIFSKTMGLGPPKDVFFVFLVFSRKRWFFGSKPSFSREKDGFTRRRPPKTIFFWRKRWFSQEKTSKNHLFLEKKMVSNQKNHLFLEKTKKTIFWRPQPHSFGKDVSFGVFVFFVFWFLLVSCFVVVPLIWLRLGCHPRWVHWGGAFIYLFICLFIYIYILVYKNHIYSNVKIYEDEIYKTIKT